MPGGLSSPSFIEKIVPRVSVANERWPVEPIVKGCASAK